MGRLCERPGCADVAEMAYGFDADRLLVWLARRDAEADPLRAGGLCRRHADAMVVPRGWTLDDRREPMPRLFRSVPDGAPRPRAAARRSRPAPRADQLVLETAGPPPGAAPADAAPTVADVSGTRLTGDPDATRAIPWLPDLDDVDDDLDGLLAADSPLLARAFRGTDRPRD
jgi:hypothetical protein